LTGSGGEDVFLFEAGDGADTVFDFELDDLLEFFGFSADEIEIVQGGKDVIVAGSGADAVEVKLDNQSGSSYAVMDVGGGTVTVTIDAAGVGS